MRTTRDNQGKGDIKDQRTSSRPDKPRVAAGPRSRTAEPRGKVAGTRGKASEQTGHSRPAGKPDLPNYPFRGKRITEPARDINQNDRGAKSSGFGAIPRTRKLSGATQKPTTRATLASRDKVAKTAEPVRETDFLSGRNPVMEALRSGRPISKLYVVAGDHQGSIREIVALAKEKGIPVQIAEQARLDAMSLGIKNQGVVAMVSPVAYASVEEIIAIGAEKAEKSCIILLDQLKDPQNLGAVLRTADAAGAHGVLIPQRRSCQLSASVAKASAGAIEYVKVAQIGNVARTLEDLKKQGFWVVGADPDQGTDYHDVDLTGPVVIVIGDEGEGMARLTRENCDMLVRIPMRGKVQSLNASVASAIILYEMLRQRGHKSASR